MSGVARRVWEELSHPLCAAEKGAQTYYHHARTELIDLFRHEPRRVLDVGCGGGATSAEIKRRFPTAYVIGIELNESAAAQAAQHTDVAICGSVETLDFAEHAIARESVDTVLFPDVLEHLRDPWALLRRLRPFVCADAQIVASIPNMRNMWLISELVKGNWTYEPDGLLDVTHLRFFTLKGIRTMFEGAGYAIRHVGHLLDGRTAERFEPVQGQIVNLSTDLLALKGLSADDVQELRSMQFLIVATPR